MAPMNTLLLGAIVSEAKPRWLWKMAPQARDILCQIGFELCPKCYFPTKLLCYLSPRDLPSSIDCLYPKSLSATYDLDFCSALLAHFFLLSHLHLMFKEFHVTILSEILLQKIMQWYFWKVTREVMKYHRVASWSTRGAAECTSGCHEVILYYFKCYFSRYSSSGGCLVGFLVHHEMAITPCFRTMLSSSVVF